MKKLLFIILTITILGTSYYFLSREKPKQATSNSIEEKIKKQLKKMTLDEKIAQMLIIYYSSTTYDETLEQTIKEVKPGGFILMNDNISTYQNTLNLVKSMQKDSKIPMIISIDQEGGIVQRLQKITDIEVTNIPSMLALGKTNDKNLAYNVGKIMAQQLKTLGINLDFAPVVDIYSNKDNKVIANRSFGSNSEEVTTMALALKQGLEDNNVNTCLKHFPGHGDTAVDSHYNLPVINKDYNDLSKVELIPYYKAIKNNTNMIMIGHIALPKITKDNTPASLSKEIITNLLKTKLKYQGLVITDALNMKALTDNYSDKEIYTMAINAGVDLLLMPNGSRKAIEYIKESIKEKKITEQKINTSVTKILTYKYNHVKEEYLDSSYLNKEEYNKILNQIKNP